MEKKHKILFLYTEIAAYFISCVKALSEKGVEVYVVRWPLNKEAPFQFDENKVHVKMYNRKDYTPAQLNALVNEIQPDLIYCSGWVDKAYLQICKQYSKKIPVLGGLDTMWTGDMKQRIWAFISPFTVRKYFNHLLLAGEPQRTYAERLGFKRENILTGLYSADVNFFSSYYKKFRQHKKEQFPKRFIYVGRYLEFKGIFEMWDAFDELSVEYPNDWELWCLGTGDLWDKRMEHPRIKHFGFVQPEEMEKFLAETGVFILPSKFEPWAVVVHEFCAAGFPVLCSDSVGAASQFVRNGENGFIFKSGEVSAIKQSMKKIMEMNADELLAMGDKSHELSLSLTPDTWAQQLINVLEPVNHPTR